MESQAGIKNWQMCLGRLGLGNVSEFAGMGGTAGLLEGLLVARQPIGMLTPHIVV
jgi:hypothetical protein